MPPLCPSCQSPWIQSARSIVEGETVDVQGSSIGVGHSVTGGPPAIGVGRSFGTYQTRLAASLAPPPKPSSLYPPAWGFLAAALVALGVTLINPELFPTGAVIGIAVGVIVGVLSAQPLRERQRQWERDMDWYERTYVCRACGRRFIDA